MRGPPSLRSVALSVAQAHKGSKSFPYPSWRYWAFTGALLASLIVAYIALVGVARSTLESLPLLTAAYFLTATTAISLGHQAFHGVLLTNRRLNGLIGAACFAVLGIDGSLWRKRHVLEHHRAPNTRGYDHDIDDPTFFRLSPFTARRWYHRYQHLYAPLVYSCGVIVSIVITDFAHLAAELKSAPTSARLRISAGFAARKAIFLTVWFIIPLAANQSLSAGQFILVFFLATVPSAWLFLPIAAAHLNEHVQFFEDATRPDFYTLQALTTVDFCRTSTFMTMLYGGLNCHLAHHLWPRVACCHYPRLTERLLSEAPLARAVRSLSLIQLFRSHWRFLKKMGVLPAR